MKPNLYCQSIQPRALNALAALVLTATVALGESAPPTAQPSLPDPSKGEIVLPAENGWQATLILDNGAVALWTVESFKVFPQLGAPEVVGLDDLGRAWVCVSYSGRWTPTPVISDGLWLGGLAHGDVDPRIVGAEFYTGGKHGNLYQVVSYPHGVLDYRLVAYYPGHELHTLLAGDFLPGSPGQELLVFTHPGEVHLVTPTAKDGKFESKLLAELPGRVRQAALLPSDGSHPPTVATVSRAGRLELMQVTASGLSRQTIHEESMGMGRIALRPPREGEPTVLYSTLDDGRILRHERLDGTNWQTGVIYHGPQGPRAVAAGRFNEDPKAETVAIFGYGKRVEILTREGDRWRAETAFEDRDKGHWMVAAELDGRNGTDELVATGYGGRIVLLSRPPGYGRKETAVETKAEAPAGQ